MAFIDDLVRRPEGAEHLLQLLGDVVRRTGLESHGDRTHVNARTSSPTVRNEDFKVRTADTGTNLGRLDAHARRKHTCSARTIRNQTGCGTRRWNRKIFKQTGCSEERVSYWEARAAAHPVAAVRAGPCQHAAHHNITRNSAQTVVAGPHAYRCVSRVFFVSSVHVFRRL